MLATHFQGRNATCDQVGLEIMPYRSRISLKPADYTHLSQLSVKYVLFGPWQSSEDQDQLVAVISV
jgi:hypothetical protein